ncbi:MAG: hypothetical protein IPJ97_08720 [Proteobacteria bacterium]|nr:hypothetical protein [Pseudomonadota bacterium]
MMKFQIAEAPRFVATMSLAFAIMLGGPAGTAVAQVTVLLPTDGDIKATLALPGDIQRGKEAYAECQTCHRQDGSGAREDGYTAAVRAACLGVDQAADGHPQ